MKNARRSRGPVTQRAAKRAPRRARPRIGRPPGKTSEQTRARILVAARACFARAGYERATNRDVAAKAGVTAAAIYQYFDSKAELYAALVQDTLDALAPRLHEITAAKRPTRTTLAALVHALMSGEASDLGAAPLLASVPAEMQRHPEVARALLAHPGSIFAAVRDVVIAGVRSREVEKAKAERTIAVVIAALMGLSAHRATIGGSHSEEATRGFIELLEGTLFR